MRLIITRHGQTTQNESGIIMGRTPGDLSELGQVQARLLGKRLKDETIDIIYCSPSTRCRDTLKEILPQLTNQPAIEFTDDLLERDFGQLTGKAIHPSMYELLENDSSESRELGVEPIDHLLARTKNFINTIIKQNADTTVLILTHSNNIRALLMYFLDKTFVEILNFAKVKNCAFTEFQSIPAGGFELVVLDDVSHLS